MDARIRTGASASDQPAGAAYCPPAGAGPGSASAGASAKAAAGGTTAGAGAAKAGGGYSSSFGDVGTSDYVGPSDSGGSGSNGRSADHHPAEAFKEVGAKIGELKEFASYYVAAKLDAYKVAARNVGVYAALGVVGLIAGGTIISTAAVLLLVGIAWGLGKLLWGQLWLGALIVGLLVLGGLAAGIILFMKKLTGTSHKQTVEKYQNRQRDQRINFGEDVRGRRAGSGH
jgi:hypothetical protein